MRRGSIGKLVVNNGFIQELLVRQMDSVLFVLEGCLILLVVHLPLQKLSILRESHLLVFEWQFFKLPLEFLFLLIIVRKLIHEFVHVFCDCLVIEKFVFPEVAIFNSRINFVIGGVISIIRKKAFALILMEAE